MRQAVILAAGLGSRLGELTREVPKALIDVAGRPLIDYALAFSARAGAERRAVVGGFYYDDVAARVRQVAPEAELVENAEYEKGNLVTLGSARPLLDAAHGFLLMNVDHVYNPTIADLVGRVAGAATRVTAFCDRDRELSNDDMKVAVDSGGRVADMAKTLESWDCGYVGMTFVPAALVSSYWECAAAATDRLGDAIHVESVLVELASSGRAPEIADISGHGWLEVDEPHERDHAESVLAKTQWWA